jgi:hypothetical protein
LGKAEAAVLKAMTRTGLVYWPSSKSAMTVSSFGVGLAPSRPDAATEIVEHKTSEHDCDWRTDQPRQHFQNRSSHSNPKLLPASGPRLKIDLGAKRPPAAASSLRALGC